MRPVSASFLTTLRGSHASAVDARICSTYQEGTSPDGVAVEVIEGSVELDGTAEIRSTLDLLTGGDRRWPRRASDALASMGQEVFVRRGLALAGGSIEWVSLGFHRVNTIEQSAPPDGPIRVAATDRMSGLIDGRLLAPVQFPASTTYGSVMEQLVTEVYPSATVEWDDDTESDTLGRSLIAEEDRHGFLNEMVRALGKTWYWDHRGILVIKDPPDPGSPVWDVNHGAGGVLVEMSRRLTREGVYNAVVASGEAGDTAAPVRAVAVDNSPTSATYFYGRFGPVPRYFSSPFLKTQAQATSAATNMLRQQLGLPYSVNLALVPNVALEPFDPVRIRYSDRDGAEVHVLERLGIPLVPDQTMTAATREQTVILIGSL